MTQFSTIQSKKSKIQKKIQKKSKKNPELFKAPHNCSSKHGSKKSLKSNQGRFDPETWIHLAPERTGMGKRCSSTRHVVLLHC